jgi:DNA repair exonuclease SbcCD ATPase subunit
MSKIKRLVIKNCLGIEERSINVSNVNVISGGNAKGKTSILEVIEKALYNTDRRDQFVKIGEEKAYIELQTDDGMVVERSIDSTDEKKSSLKVTQDGIPVRAPQTFLDQLFGVTKERKDVFAFNPVDFMNKPAKEQTKILLSMLPITVSQKDMLEWFWMVPPVNSNLHGLLVLKELEKYWYDARHEANGAVRATQAEVDALHTQLPDNYEVEKWEDVSTMELSDKIRAAEQIGNYIQAAKALIADSTNTLDAINNKYNLQVKDANDLLEFKIKKVKDEVEKQKYSIVEEVTGIEFEIGQHEEHIEELKKEIERTKSIIAELQHEISLKKKDIETFDTSIITTKTESLTNELNVTVKSINDNRNREINELDERIAKAKRYILNNRDQEGTILELEQEYKTAERMKGFVEMAHNLQKVKDKLIGEIQCAEKYDSFVQFCRNKPFELLKTVQLPVNGLSINDDGAVCIDGLPMKNLNTAKQVTVCLDIARAYASGTVFKLINVDKFEHLDETARNEFLKQIEDDSDFQYFISVVTDGELKIETK